MWTIQSCYHHQLRLTFYCSHNTIPEIERDSSILGVVEGSGGSAIPKIECDGSISGVVEGNGIARGLLRAVE